MTEFCAGAPGVEVMAPAVPLILPPALIVMPLTVLSVLLIAREPLRLQLPPQVSAEAGAARRIGRSFKITLTVAVASAPAAAAGVQAPASALQPTEVTSTLALSIAANETVKPGNADGGSSTASPTAGQLQVRAVPVR